MNNIKIYKDSESNKIMFEYDEKAIELNFENLKEFSKEILKLENIDEYDPEIEFESSETLYKQTLEDLIKSIKEDKDLRALYEKSNRE